MKIIERGERITATDYEVEFYKRAGDGVIDFDRPVAAFDCDETGRINEAQLEDAGRANLAELRALKCPSDLRKFERSYWKAPIGECQCGERLSLPSFTNTCKCGRMYNGSGQALCHPSQWGEETGERFDNEGNQIS